MTVRRSAKVLVSRLNSTFCHDITGYVKVLTAHAFNLARQSPQNEAAMPVTDIAANGSLTVPALLSGSYKSTYHQDQARIKCSGKYKFP